MTADATGGEGGDTAVVELHALVTRVVGARVRDPDTADDVVQETVTRVLAARGRLDDGALAPYAVVTARNIVRSLGRDEGRRRRHSHRLVEGAMAPSPEDEVAQEEERAALGLAWSRLGSEERRALADHEVAGTAVAAMAEKSNSTPGAVAVRLARTRDKLRVEYLLALRRTELPSARCRSVLLAISARDQRRQEALAAGEHLLRCECCASLSEPLVKRSRPLVALWPLLAAWQVLRRLGRGVSKAARWARGHPVHATGAGAGLAVVGASLIMFTGSDSGWLRSGERSLLPPPSASEVVAAGQPPVEARSITVQSVLTPTGFWVGTNGNDRLFVELLAPPAFPVAAGQEVSFSGYIEANHEDSVERFGLTGPDAEQFRQQGYHLHAEGNVIRDG